MTWRGVESCLLCWFRIVRNFGQALSRILAFAVVGVGASLCRLCATAIVHLLHVYERSVGFASCETLGVHFIRHPCLTRKLRVLPPAAPKNSTPLVERGAIFGADGGGRTRTVLLPTDFESVTSTNSITPALTLFIISDEWPKFKRNLCFRRKIPDSAGRMAVPSCKERKIGVLCL